MQTNKRKTCPANEDQGHCVLAGRRQAISKDRTSPPLFLMGRALPVQSSAITGRVACPYLFSGLFPAGSCAVTDKWFVPFFCACCRAGDGEILLFAWIIIQIILIRNLSFLHRILTSAGPGSGPAFLQVISYWVERWPIPKTLEACFPALIYDQPVTVTWLHLK